MGCELPNSLSRSTRWPSTPLLELPQDRGNRYNDSCNRALYPVVGPGSKAMTSWDFFPFETMLHVNVFGCELCEEKRGTSLSPIPIHSASSRFITTCLWMPNQHGSTQSSGMHRLSATESFQLMADLPSPLSISSIFSQEMASSSASLAHSSQRSPPVVP